jgi:RimJ/RimL family protein N-acetyltransferase
MNIGSLPLQTPSLLLRHFVPEDAQTVMHLNAEETTRQWLPSHVYENLDEATESLAHLIACYASPGDPRRGPFVLAIEHGRSQQLLGHVGFSPLGAEVEVSYAIAERARGHGYGAQALLHACRWAASTFALPGVFAITGSANLPSRRTLERSGFENSGDKVMRFQGTEQAVRQYRWLARRSDEFVA